MNDFYYDHTLKCEPWSGYREFHVMDDLLVVYYKIDSKKRIRMVTITSHEELSTGKLQS
ncbi:MAG: type II toxin-antitoxin system YafQ family toxin [Lactobacillales bacterium]|nr:type II toxin-antitoxin system YafQ family toxin [Lactobacillales bacterium]